MSCENNRFSSVRRKLLFITLRSAIDNSNTTCLRNRYCDLKIISPHQLTLRLLTAVTLIGLLYRNIYRLYFRPVSFFPTSLYTFMMKVTLHYVIFQSLTSAAVFHFLLSSFINVNVNLHLFFVRCVYLKLV